MCKRCLGIWKAKSNDCPLCKMEFQSDRIPKKILALLNDSEFNCPYNCGESFRYENRKKHFASCQEVASVLQNCTFCQAQVNNMPGGLA